MRGSKWIARVVKSISNSILCSDVGSIERETTIVMRTRAHVLSNRFISQHLFSDCALRFWNSPQFFLVLLLVGQTSLLFQFTEWSPNHFIYENVYTSPKNQITMLKNIETISDSLLDSMIFYHLYVRITLKIDTDFFSLLFQKNRL